MLEWVLPVYHVMLEWVWPVYHVMLEWVCTQYGSNAMAIWSWYHTEGLLEHVASYHGTEAMIVCYYTVPYSGKFSGVKIFADWSLRTFSCFNFRG